MKYAFWWEEPMGDHGVNWNLIFGWGVAMVVGAGVWYLIIWGGIEGWRHVEHWKHILGL